MWYYAGEQCKRTTQCLYNAGLNVTLKIKEPFPRQLKSPLNVGRRTRSHFLKGSDCTSHSRHMVLNNNVNLVNTTGNVHLKMVKMAILCYVGFATIEKGRASNFFILTIMD